MAEAASVLEARLQKAEFATLIVVLGLYLAANDIALAGTSLAMAGTIVYVYFRALFGYPNVGIVPVAVARGLVLILSQVWGIVAKLAKNLY